MQVRIERVAYGDSRQGGALLALLDAYAQGPTGGGTPLAGEVKATLLDKLAACPTAFSLLAYVDDEPAGLVNCFEGFSTFAAKPLINIHDLVVLPRFRGLQLSQQLLAGVEALARERGCCKLTLEVLSGNAVAQGAYRKFGFAGYELDPLMGQALFWQKALDE